jgi:hypothetical protein
MALRLTKIRELSQRHATRLPSRFSVDSQEPGGRDRGAKTPQVLVAQAIFFFDEAARLAFRGYLLRATHAFAFAEALSYAAGAYSIQELREMRPNGQSGTRTGLRASVRRALYKIGEWFFQQADRL